MNQDTTDQKEKAVLLSQLVEVDQLYLNVSQQLIVTTEDKVELCLNKHYKNAEKKREWLTPFSLFVAIALVFATSDFKLFILSAATWEAIFIILAASSLCWFLFSIKSAFRNIEIDLIIDELKAGGKSKPQNKDN